MKNFKKELRILINRHSIENQSNTPDFIIAEYLMDCLTAYNKVHNSYGGWCGTKKLE